MFQRQASTRMAANLGPNFNSTGEEGAVGGGAWRQLGPWHGVPESGSSGCAVIGRITSGDVTPVRFAAVVPARTCSR